MSAGNAPGSTPGAGLLGLVGGNQGAGRRPCVVGRYRLALGDEDRDAFDLLVSHVRAGERPGVGLWRELRKRGLECSLSAFRMYIAGDTLQPADLERFNNV